MIEIKTESFSGSSADSSDLEAAIFGAMLQRLRIKNSERYKSTIHNEKIIPAFSGAQHRKYESMTPNMRSSIIKEYLSTATNQEILDDLGDFIPGVHDYFF